MSKVAIIGSGMGGLTASCLLAQRGHAVTLFESHTTPGGYTAGFWRNGFYFESGTLSFEMSSQVFALAKELGIWGQVEFVPFNSRFLASEFDFIPRDFAEFREGVMSAFPGEAERLERYFSAIRPMVQAMHRLMLGKRTLPMIAGAVGIMGQWLKYRRTTLGEFTARFFDPGSRLYGMFKSLGYPDMSAWILGGGIVTILHDYWTVKEGMQSWADALADRFRMLGGELKLKSRVDRILTRNGTAVGVSVNGQVHDADWVISASDYKKTFLELLDDPALVPPAQMEKIRSTAVSEGVVTVYLGLALSHDELRRHLQIPHVMLLDEQPGLDIRNPSDPDHFLKASVGLYSPSLQNPLLAPAGKSSLMIQAQSPYRWMDNWGGEDRERYRQLKERAKQALIAKAGRFIPCLDEKIIFSDAATPRTYERFTGNSDGATSAWSWNPNNRFYRGMMKSTVDTPVPRLLIGSCWASQIGGIPGALAAARLCGKRIGASKT